MAYSQPPQYSFGDSGDHQSQQHPSGPPAYSPQPPPPPQFQTQPVGPPPVLGPPPARSGGGALPFLIIALALCAVGAALFLIMWLQAKGDLEEAQSLADDRGSEVDGLESDLADAEARVTELEGQVEELEGEATNTETMQACLDDLEAYYDTEPGSDEEQTALDAFYVTCEEWIY